MRTYKKRKRQNKTRKRISKKQSPVKKIVVKKKLSDEETRKLEGKRLPKGYFKKIIKNQDVDVYTDEGNLLLRFRKGVLPLKHINDAYEGMIKHARQKTHTRGVTGGDMGQIKVVKNNVPIMSNIMGYFDTLDLGYKKIFKEANMRKPICRETAFTGRMPEKWDMVKPLIKDIDRQYKNLFPKEHRKQKRAAQSTKYVIENTAFTTITTNLNLQTACHYDKGDWKAGFGNLVVIERGKYKGGYTGFPQYGLAIDVRTGDFLGMDVHQLHGNEPIECVTEGCERLSLVSYLREGIVNKCQKEPLFTEKYMKKARMKAAENKNL